VRFSRKIAPFTLAIGSRGMVSVFANYPSIAKYCSSRLNYSLRIPSILTRSSLISLSICASAVCADILDGRSWDIPSRSMANIPRRLSTHLSPLVFRHFHNEVLELFE